MLDSEKVELISNILQEFWTAGIASEDSAVATLNAIATVVDFKRKDNKKC